MRVVLSLIWIIEVVLRSTVLATTLGAKSRYCMSSHAADGKPYCLVSVWFLFGFVAFICAMWMRCVECLGFNGFGWKCML